MQSSPRHIPLYRSDTELAESLGKLWPHRLHESNCFKGLFCWAGLHRWSRLNLEAVLPERQVAFCRWCEKVRLDGAVYPILEAESSQSGNQIRPTEKPFQLTDRRQR